jgi:hypothetical protein
MKLSLTSFDIVVSLPSDPTCSVIVGKAFWLEPESYPYFFSERWRENWSIAVIEDLSTVPKELFKLLEATGDKVINSVCVTRGEFLAALDEVGYKVSWCAEKVLRLEPIDLRDAWKSVPHRQS